MLSLKERSYKKELLDNDDIPFEDIKQNMKELNTINTLLGGHAITIKGVKALLNNKSHQKLITICEIGCGGGDNINAIYNWGLKNNLNVQFIGIDIKQTCIDFAAIQYPNLPATWLANDYKEATFKVKPDIVFSSLFCHHFNEKELKEMLVWMKENTKVGFFINDLHRNIFAYYSIKFLTGLFSKSYLVKNDAPLSVARGFKISEWNTLLTHAGITNYDSKWKWAFRHLITYKH